MAVAVAGSYVSTYQTIAASTTKTVYSTTTTSTATFTADAGETIVVKVVAGVYQVTATSATNAYSGSSAKATVNFTLVGSYNSSTSSPIYLFVGVVTAAGAVNIGVSVTNSKTAQEAAVVFSDRYTGVVAPATWNVGGITAPVKSSPYSTTITTVTDNAVIAWLASDYNGVYTSSTYTASNFAWLSGATLLQHYAYTSTGVLDAYSAYQTAGAAGPQTVGYTNTTKTGQAVILAGIELPSVGPAVPNTAQFFPFFG